MYMIKTDKLNMFIKFVQFVLKYLIEADIPDHINRPMIDT